MPRSNQPSYNPLPKNIELITEYDAIAIRRRWKNVAAYALIFFSLIWNGFMYGWMYLAISKGAWTMAAFGTIHVAVGIFLIYFTIATFLNKTDIRIDAYNLAVKHYPLPWRGQLKIPVEDIQQVYCKEKITKNNNNSTSVTYELHCIDRSNRSKKLISGLNDSSQARFFETEIEKILGIKDEQVRGELRK